jgi:muramoyltetrapeptide carboxypeptidase
MPICNPDGSAFTVWRDGPAAEGPLLGGNLALLTSLVGTPWMPPLDGAILALEDVGEKPYTVDRMLTQLALAGVFDRVGALLLGDFDHCFPPHYPDPAPSLREVVESCLGDRPLPVLANVLHGHITVRSTLPLGAWTRVTTDPPTICVDPQRRDASARGNCAATRNLCPNT